MNEFKNGSDIVLHRGDFPAKSLRKFAVMTFVEAPKFITIARHVDLADVTRIHCVTQGEKRKIRFQVLKQKLNVKYDAQGIRYTVVKVIDSHGILYTLVANENNRHGFLLNPYCATRLAILQAKHLRVKRKNYPIKRVRVVDSQSLPRI